MRTFQVKLCQDGGMMQFGVLAKNSVEALLIAVACITEGMPFSVVVTGGTT